MRLVPWLTMMAALVAAGDARGAPPELPFYDQGTYEQIIELR